MRDKLHKKNRIVYCIALVIALVLTVFSFYEKEKEVQYDIVVLGDSVVGNIWGKVSMTKIMEERLGKSVFRGAFGGTGMSVHETNMWGSMANSEWCMVRLAEAICYDDWKSQKATMKYADAYKDVNTQALNYFETTMDTLSKIDFSKVEILIIEHGTNDYNIGRPVDNPEDPYDVTTFGGALRRSLSLLQEAYPNLRIVLMSPLYCELGGKPCYNTSYGDGGILDEYVLVEKEIAQEFGVEWIDAYWGLGIWEDNAGDYLSDYLHPNVAGHELLGDFMSDYFEANVK